jgi:acyl-CoA reductase-like NAD-dependent aldehyde dehydrogenase
MDVTPNMRIFQEPILGPVLTLSSYRNDEEGLSLANATAYGKNASIWTQDLARAHRIGPQLKAAAIWVNHLGSRDPALPTSGHGLSGSAEEFGPGAVTRVGRHQTMFIPSR